MEIKIQLQNADEIMRFLEERPEKTREEINNAIKKSVFAVWQETRIKSPVKTGLMRASIRTKEYELKGEVGVGVKYAIYVHEGTRYMKGRPFLADAVRSMELAIQRFFKEAITNVITK